MSSEPRPWPKTVPDSGRTSAPGPGPLVLPDDYEDLGVLARGAMGEVRRVRERSLGQILAMKISAWNAAEDRRFLLEARAMAALRHPGILAVHDHGVLADGRPWFTTREIEGVTLGRKIRDFHGSASGGETTFRSLLESIARAAEAVGFAHRSGVFHRDLKPDNILVGVHGEVVVVDWGLTSRRMYDPDETDDEVTADGDLLGTPAYMSPEQAAGDSSRDHARSDVFCLGACLFELLTGAPPYPHPSPVARRMALSPPVPLPIEPASSTPSDLEDIAELCRTLMHPDPAYRPADARQAAERLSSCLTARSRRHRAIERVHRAAEHIRAIESLRQDIEDLRARAAAHLVDLGPRAPAGQKAVGWALEDAASEARIELRTQEALYVQQLRAALNEDGDLPDAHALLASHFRERMALAEARGQAEEAAYCEVMCLQHDRAGAHRSWLDGTCEVDLHTAEPGATVELYRYEPVHRRLELVHLATLGPTPVRTHALHRGSYLAEVGGVPYPFTVDRDRPWSNTPPESDQPAVIPPRAEGDVCLVPAGWFLCGGDDEAADGLPGRRVWLDSFAVSRLPVRFAEYLAFVRDVDASGEHDVYPLLPMGGTGVSQGEQPLIDRGSDGRYTLQTSAYRPLAPDLPAVQVTWHQARAYAQWLARRTGLPWRLLHELEWEKAARGVDGRVFPWGNFLDPTWACMLDSHAGPAHARSVHDFPLDVSPYGVRGMAGNVREWCLDDYTREPPGTDRVARPEVGSGPYRMIRGGSWSSAANFCRAAGRFAAAPDQHLTSLGFRLGYSL